MQLTSMISMCIFNLFILADGLNKYILLTIQNAKTANGKSLAAVNVYAYGTKLSEKTAIKVVKEQFQYPIMQWNVT